jgi:alpha-tubulin suppressor-like RCC1 family protein
MRNGHPVSQLRKHFRNIRRAPSGDTIVEVLIAVAIVSMILVGASTSSSHSAAALRTSQEHGEAETIGNSQIEQIVAHNGLDGAGSQCYDSTGHPAKNEVDHGCDFSTQNASGCSQNSEGYCYNVLVSQQTTILGLFTATTYKVTITWDKLGGNNSEKNSVVMFYRIPIAAPAGPPAPPGPLGNMMAQIDVGNYHVCANSLAGGGYCWGKNDFGQLGNGTNNNSSVPFAVNDAGVLAGKTIVATSAGYNHTCVVDSVGQVYCWGYNSQGQLGNGASGTNNNPIPTAVVTTGPISGKKVIKINGGNSHTCALTLDGLIFCWGGNNYGQLGTDNTTDSFTPVQLTNSGPASGKTWVDISAGYAHSCGLTGDGTAYCWGFNGHGQLGNNSTIDSSRPVAVSTGLKFAQISAGDQHTCALTTGGALYCWGFNQQGQLGNNSLVDSAVPVPVDTSGVLGGKTASKVTAGFRHTCAIADGDVYCWGNDDAGQLGNGQLFVTHTSPVAVDNTGDMNGEKMADIAVGQYNSCAVATVASGGNIYCWGKDDDGQLGNGNVTTVPNYPTPTLVTFIN